MCLYHGREKFSDLQCLNYWKMHFRNFSSLLHDVVISPHLKHRPINMPKRVWSPMQNFFKKKVPPSLIFISFPIPRSFIRNFCGTNYGFSSKRFSKYGYQIFQTISSLNSKTIQLKTFNLVINFSIISNRVQTCSLQFVLK